MNPLVKKEIRLLLPTWIAAVLLTITSLLLTIGRDGIIYLFEPIDLHIFLLLLGATFLSIASFGQEFSSGTFTLSLSQPIERRRIWFIKTTVLALAFASIFLTLLVSWELYYFHFLLNWRIFLTVLKYAGFTALCAFALFSSGLWTTLLVRQMTGAFWLTLLTPLAIVVAISASLNAFISSEQIVITVALIGLALYALAGFYWARRLFLRAQDVQWTGGIIGFPSRKGISERTAGRSRHWLSALAWKELQLHQANLLIAVVVLALHLASVVIRKVHPQFADSTVEEVLEQVWALWLLMPLLIGSAAVGEERKLGVIELQLCLPVSRRVQFLTKFSVALLLSLFLGAFMPLIIESPGDLITFTPLAFLVASTAIFFISLYASTLARTTIQAIGLAIVVAGVIYFYQVVTAVGIFFRLGYSFSNQQFGLELLKLYLGVPILLFVLAGLMYWNFKWLHQEGKLRWRNGICGVPRLIVVIPEHHLLIH
ncbi:MAG: hypothetical protein ACREDQ_05305 [Limisphaerales bacterium]